MLWTGIKCRESRCQSWRARGHPEHRPMRRCWSAAKQDGGFCCRRLGPQPKGGNCRGTAPLEDSQSRRRCLARRFTRKHVTAGRNLRLDVQPARARIYAGWRASLTTTLRPRRTVVLAAAVAGGAALSVSALGVANGWWFLGGGSPKPTTPGRASRCTRFGRVPPLAGVTLEISFVTG